VFRHIFTGPNSAMQASEVMAVTCKNNAKIHGMTTVSPENIAYAAVQVRNNCIECFIADVMWVQARFMISSTQKFVDVDGLFSYPLFYDSIIDIFKTMDEGWRTDTLDWWQR
jgi:hypothetical protein